MSLSNQAHQYQSVCISLFLCDTVEASGNITDGHGRVSSNVHICFLGSSHQVVKMEPRDKDGRRKLKECESALRKQRFEEAIMTPEVEMVSFHQPTAH